MSEETDKTRLQTIIHQNKIITDKLTVIQEWITNLNVTMEKVNLEPIPKDNNPEGVYYAEHPEDVPSENTATATLPKERITSPEIVGTCDKKPKQQYSVYLLGDETEKAIKIRCNGIEGWLPKSTLYDKYPNQLGVAQKMWIQSWIIEKSFTVKE